MRLTLFSLIASTLLTACSAPPYVDYDTGFGFTRVTSYFIDPPTTGNDPLMEDRVQAAIDTELTAKGLNAAPERKHADLAVRYSLAVEDRPNTNRVSVGMGTGSYGNSGGVSVGGAVSRPVGGSTRQHLVIQIDMSPGTEQRLVWRARDSLELRGDATRRAADAQNLVTRLLADFPPRQTQQ